MMKLLHVVTSLGDGFGVSAVVEALLERQSSQGHEVTVMSLGEPQKKEMSPVIDLRFGPDHRSPKAVAKLGRSHSLRSALHAASVDLYHTHGLWMMPNVYPAEAARRRGKPFVLSPHGMLGHDALKFSYAAKRVFWAVWQRRAVDAVSCFHATAESEYEDIRAYGLKQPVAVIPNGIDLPDLSGLEAEGAPQPALAEPPFILSLGRVHPKKGLGRLVAAFALVAQDHPELRLRIVGPDEGGHAAELKRQITAAGLEGRVTIEPPVFGADKLRLMRRAEVFALSTLHENFAMTVAESLAVETPVISTRGAPWAGLEAQRCGWWIDHGPAAMATALREAMAMPAEVRAAMGARGRDWMRRDFGWDGIGAKMLAVYAWLLGLQERPEWVQP